MSLINKIQRRIRSERRNRPLNKFVKRCTSKGIILRPYQAQHLLRINNLVGWQDKTILEIGGDLEGTAARAIIMEGARHVTSINMDPKFDLNMDIPGVTRQFMDARDLTFAENSFDIVFGIAVLEHFSNFDKILEEICRVTSPGGFVYMYGGPLWNSALGHHLVVTGPSGTEYHFAKHNVMQDWLHLLHDRNSLSAELSCCYRAIWYRISLRKT